MLNKIILIGNVGQDPDIRVTQNGAKLATFSLATSESWKTKTGERKDSTEWHRIVIYNEKLAEIAEKYIKKGTKLYLEGSMHYRKFTDNDGKERNISEVLLQGFSSNLKILDSRKEGSNGSSFEEKSDNSSFESSSEIDDEVPF